MAFSSTCIASMPADQSKVMGLEQLWAEALWNLLPIWVAVLVGLVLGWSWKPKWVTLFVVALRSKPRLVWSIPPGFGARRLWLAATAAAAAPFIKDTLAAIKAWAEQVQRRWQLMQQHLRALRAQEVASFFPAGRLTKRAQRMLLKETPRRDSSSPSPVLESAPARSTPKFTPSGIESVSAQEAALLAGFLPSRPVHPPVPISDKRTCEASSTASPSSSSSSEAAEGARRPLAVISPLSSDSLDSPREGCSPGLRCQHSEVVTEEDLDRLMEKLEDEDGTKTGQAWGVLMEKKTQRMAYTAWRRDPQNGPTEYRSRTVVEDCPSETMRDFFWDDDFRPEWDGMLAEWSTLEACAGTGVQVVRWVRKFPLFCKDREYIIGRRIWSHGNTFYCVTKGLAHHPDAPRKDKPRRVDQFYSSWRIQPLEGGCCEVMLFHQEDMGIQRDVAKMGVRQGMWGAVKKIEPGVRSFTRSRSQIKDPAQMPRSLSMAKLNTPIIPADAAPSTPRDSGSSLLEHRRVRKWVSAFDLTQVEAAATAVEIEGVPSQEPSCSEHTPSESAEASSSGSPRKLAVVGEESDRPSAAESSSGSSTHPVSGDVGTSNEAVRAVEGLELVVRKSREVGEAQGRGGRKMHLVVAATAVALVCRLEAGVLVKLAVAGALKHALSGRRR